MLVLCSLAAFQLESLIADICDGDATPTQLAAFEGSASDLPPHAAEAAAARAGRLAVSPATTTGAAERGGTLGTLGALTRATGADAARPGSAPVPTHSAHACHCVHAHGGVLPRLETVEVTIVAVRPARPFLRDLAPPSVTREPRLRPPLA